MNLPHVAVVSALFPLELREFNAETKASGKAPRTGAACPTAFTPS